MTDLAKPDMNVKYAADRIAIERPGLREALDFLVDILAVQRELAREVISPALEPILPEMKEAARNVGGGRSLVDLVGLPGLSPSAWERIALRILEVIREHRRDLESQVAVVEGAIKSGRLKVREFVESSLSGDGERVRREAEKLGVEAPLMETLSLWLAQTLLRPLSSAILGDIGIEGWREGRCPVCGSQTRIGYMRGEGRKLYLKCPVCGAEWPFQRIKCPFCGNEDSQTLGFYTLGDDRRFRLYFCERCGRYWKVVDEEEAGSQIPTELYDVWTSHLDAIAKEKGLR